MPEIAQNVALSINRVAHELFSHVIYNYGLTPNIIHNSIDYNYSCVYSQT